MAAIILGMPGPWADDNYEASDHYTTKIGGVPDWPIPETDIRHDLLECGVCGKRLCLVAQVHAPLTRDALKVDERIIYVLGCVMPKCGSGPHSWRVLRLQKFPNAVESITAAEEVSSSAVSCESVSRSNWWEDLCENGSGEEDDDDNYGDVDLQELGRALSEAASLASHSKKQNGSMHPKDVANGVPVKPSMIVKDACIPVVPCFYIYSQEEPASSDVSAICSSYSSLSVEDNKSHIDDHREEEKWDEERYEYGRALDVDRTYLKFKKRVDAYPEQCFRYSYGSQPLLATTNLEEPGICSLCGASRHYEMQLMPPLLYFLQQTADDAPTRLPEDWSWMTLIVYTCSKSCTLALHDGKSSSDGWTTVEEGIVIQNENSLHDSARLAYFS
ncbi:hypothetical protein MRB53_029379 [Persea americana]|uniref:Uncharacterized protein n=1 Tax=Persea americana TaxID=3435 RepID=A0ACC2KI95_PERAE|nr:hypothetical protein MRB53_029379 [Persea americana]